ncbi:hypothetical protein C8R48DRAFT_727872, partial [Suillus tomentosus]
MICLLHDHHQVVRVTGPKIGIVRSARKATKGANIHRSLPSARTSSTQNSKCNRQYRIPLLKNSRKSSINFNFMALRSPPTSWCVFMVALGPLKLMLSMTSGYRVPCNSHSILPFAFAPFSSFSAASLLLSRRR